MTEKATVSIFRFNPETDVKARFEDYEIPYEHWHGVKVIDTIRYIYETYAPGLGFREPCRQQVCGGCVMLVNKKPVLACAIFAEKQMVIEPLPGRKVLKDLIVAFEDEGGQIRKANGGRCEECGVCVENCPVQILRIEGGKVRYTKPQLCTHCRICREVCPDGLFGPN